MYGTFLITLFVVYNVCSGSETSLYSFCEEADVAKNGKTPFTRPRSAKRRPSQEIGGCAEGPSPLQALSFKKSCMLEFSFEEGGQVTATLGETAMSSVPRDSGVWFDLFYVVGPAKVRGASFRIPEDHLCCVKFTMSQMTVSTHLSEFPQDMILLGSYRCQGADSCIIKAAFFCSWAQKIIKDILPSFFDDGAVYFDTIDVVCDALRVEDLERMSVCQDPQRCCEQTAPAPQGTVYNRQWNIVPRESCSLDPEDVLLVVDNQLIKGKFVVFDALRQGPWVDEHCLFYEKLLSLKAKLLDRVTPGAASPSAPLEQTPQVQRRYVRANVVEKHDRVEKKTREERLAWEEYNASFASKIKNMAVSFEVDMPSVVERELQKALEKLKIQQATAHSRRQDPPEKRQRMVLSPLEDVDPSFVQDGPPKFVPIEGLPTYTSEPTDTQKHYKLQ